MLKGLKTNNTEKIEKIHNKIINLASNMDYRIFPIYIRYTKNDDLLGLLYFNRVEYSEFGINADLLEYDGECSDAMWMKYKEIKYSIKLYDNKDMDTVFKNIKLK